eukprot:c25925_g1_i1 orf=83-1063(+)
MALSRATTGSMAAIQATNDDASASKLSCVKKGYIVDNYVQFFVRRPVRRSPIINRGYYARWASLRKLLLQFLDDGFPLGEPAPKKQILSLGAGFDTTFFQLQEEGKSLHLFVEVDFKEVTSKKAMIIESRESLHAKLGPTATIVKEQGMVNGDHYRLFPVDLRDTECLDNIVDLAQLDPGLPTLILAECVLIYLDPEVSRAIVKWAAEKFSTAIFVIYEQIHPEDGFGQQMMKNLESRGCPLLGLHDTPTLEAKINRFTDLGWQYAVALDMDAIYNQHLDPHDQTRIERLELFDEFEEWHMMQEHYCIAYAINGEGLRGNFGFMHI